MADGRYRCPMLARLSATGIAALLLLSSPSPRSSMPRAGRCTSTARPGATATAATPPATPSRPSTRPPPCSRTAVPPPAGRSWSRATPTTSIASGPSRPAGTAAARRSAPVVFQASGYKAGSSTGYVKPIVSGADVAPKSGQRWVPSGTANVWKTPWPDKPFGYGTYSGSLRTALFQDKTRWLWEQILDERPRHTGQQRPRRLLSGAAATCTPRRSARRTRPAHTHRRRDAQHVPVHGHPGRRLRPGPRLRCPPLGQRHRDDQGRRLRDDRRQRPDRQPADGHRGVRRPDVERGGSGDRDDGRPQPRVGQHPADDQGRRGHPVRHGAATTSRRATACRGSRSRAAQGLGVHRARHPGSRSVATRSATTTTTRPAAPTTTPAG